MRKQLNQAQKGFTLIELLIVVAIIGILAAIAIPNLITAQRRARYSRSAGDTKSIITQAQVLTSDNNLVASVVCGAGNMPQCLWTPVLQLAPASPTVYMAKVGDPWAVAGANYQFSQAPGTGCGANVGPGCVVYSARTIGADGVTPGIAWTGAVGTVLSLDDLGNSTELGCAFGPNVGIANPC
ncbi:MAG: type II secretion system protein [Candidatus Methylomirabilales bacterium]